MCNFYQGIGVLTLKMLLICFCCVLTLFLQRPDVKEHYRFLPCVQLHRPLSAARLGLCAEKCLPLIVMCHQNAGFLSAPIGTAPVISLSGARGCHWLMTDTFSMT